MPLMQISKRVHRILKITFIVIHNFLKQPQLLGEHIFIRFIIWQPRSIFLAERQTLKTVEQ